MQDERQNIERTTSRSVVTQKGRLSPLFFAILAIFIFVAPQQSLARNVDGFRSTLSLSERKQFDAYLAARTFFNADLDAYWGKVNAKRKARRRKKRSRYSSADYVRSLPPKYKGPSLSKSLQRKWVAHQAREKKTKPRKRRQLAGVADFLASAKKYYGFVPERIPEREFKRRYAREALRLGLTKSQVVRVYALETGGNGTADMQAGIHPITKKGRPISSALGYAQLLHANSINELRKHGASFISRLERAARNPNLSTSRRAGITRKLKGLKAMYRTVRRLPDRWSRHVAFAKTTRGRGIHALNLDGDVGPWMQVIKLKGLRNFAAKFGRNSLTSSELELMNLAGPGTGIEMMTPIGRRMPTTNFFSRLGYSRNSIVRGRTAAGLLAALEERMNYNVRNKGSKEFFAVFDEVKRERSASR
ncbi:MAG: hypothetical protein ACRBCJ_10640 [Hyphomicrobiaceae bacterium]